MTLLRSTIDYPIVLKTNFSQKSRLFHVLEWDELVVSCAAFLCAEFADQRIVLASTRESLVQTLASFATQSATMRAIERVPLKQLVPILCT